MRDTATVAPPADSACSDAAADPAGAAELSDDVELELHAASVTETTPMAAIAAKARPRVTRLIMWFSLRRVLVV